MAHRYMLELYAWSPRHAKQAHRFKGFLKRELTAKRIDLGYSSELGLRITSIRFNFSSEFPDTHLLCARVSILNFQEKIDELTPGFGSVALAKAYYIWAGQINRRNPKCWEYGAFEAQDDEAAKAIFENQCRKSVWNDEDMRLYERISKRESRFVISNFAFRDRKEKVD